MPVCRVCGKANPNDARYCFSCGAAISQAPPVKVDVKSPLTPSMKPTPPGAMAPTTYSTRQVQRPGSCYYHSELSSSYVCSRCGRSICAACNRQYGVLSFCTECYWGLAPKLGSTAQYPQYGQYPQYMQYPAETQQQPGSPYYPY